jgi:hypothetical protein
MKSIACGCVVAALGLMLALTALGEDVFIPEGCPKELLRDKATGSPVPACIVIDETPLLSRPGPEGKVLAKAKYLDLFWVVQHVSDAATNIPYALLGVADESAELKSFVGWVDLRCCLLVYSALRSDHGIYKKGLITNQITKASGGEIALQSAGLYNGPGKRLSGMLYDKVLDARLFDIHYIFMAKEIEGKKWYLLGSRPAFEMHTQFKAVLEGWVSEDRTCLWDTRQAVEINKDNLEQRLAGSEKEDGGVQIYGRREDLEVAVAGGSKHADGTPLRLHGREDTSVKKWEIYWPRFPVLSTCPGGEQEGQWMEIGFIGDQYEIEAGKLKVARSRSDVSRDRNEMEAVKRALKNVDVLIVMDTTGSMRGYIGDTQKAVVGFIQELRKSDLGVAKGLEKPCLRFSIVFYRDYCDEDGKPNPDDSYLVKDKELTDNPDKITEFIQEELKTPIPNNTGGDEPEAVFHAMHESIRRSEKSLSDGYRLMILIGDKGNHVEDPRGYTIPSTLERLKASRVDLLAVHVARADMINSNRDMSLFRMQAQSLVKGLGDKRGSYEQGTANLLQTVSEAIRGAAETAEKLQEAAGEVERGTEVEQIRKTYGVKISDYLSTILKEKGISPDLFASHSMQVFERGWVSERCPRTGLLQNRVVLLVNRYDLEMLGGILAGFVKAGANLTPQTVKDLWTRVLHSQLGEAIEPDQTVAELIEKHVGLPIHCKLLHMKLTEVERLTPDQLSSLRMDLAIGREVIQGILQEKNLKVTEIKDEKTKQVTDYRTEDLGARKYWWGANRDEYAWIGADLLP